MSASAQAVTAHADVPPPRRIAAPTLIDAAGTPRLPHAQIVIVLSNRKAAKGLQRAAAATPPIPTVYLALQPYLRTHPGSTREEYDVAVARAVVDVSPDVVVLAGWMHIVSQGFLDVVRAGASGGGGGSGREVPVINVRPALPGQFDGANAMRGEVDRLGVMVHRVIAEVDRGPPVIVREVEVSKGEDLEAGYEPRMHRVEWEIIVEGTKIVLDEVKPLSVDIAIYAI
ncbi:Formyltransferase [Paxillus ammoniavirescens]|nr:Formyltransferase [Paxillus ammoniavirescens]